MTTPPSLDTALALHSARRFSDAETVLRRLLRTHPQDAPAWQLLGDVLAQTGRPADAADALRRAVAIAPADPKYRYALGRALLLVNDPAAAIDALQAGLQIRSDIPEIHFELGTAFFAARQPDRAAAAFGHAISLRPDHAESHFNLAEALAQTGQLDPAIIAYQRAVALRPDSAQFLYRLADALRARGDLAQAIPIYQRAISLDPKHALAHHNLASAYQGLSQYENAAAAYQRALDLRPNLVEGLCNYANVLRILGRTDDAIAAYRRALELRPGFFYAVGNFGNALKDSGQLDQAIAAYRQAFTTEPTDFKAHSNLLYTMYFSPNYDWPTILAEHRDWNDRYARPLSERALPHANNPTPTRKIRIAYVSPNFESHCQAFYMLPLLALHDRAQFEIFCYSDVTVPDAITQRQRAHANVWRDTARLSDEKLADLIRSDQIDILVDLTMHMAHHRLLTFARKPAPVQITWLAYPGTTGLSAIDYRLTDPYLDPPGANDADYTEQSIRLTETFWCITPLTAQHTVNDLPALKAGHITFGSLNTFCKVTDQTLQLWAKVLAAVPDSKLLLLVPNGSARPRIISALADLGVPQNRLELVDRQPRPHYLDTYHRIDIGLDTIPYNGHTTSIDSYWMGVPVITRVGRTIVGRAGLSQLSNLSLADLAAHADEDFVRISAALAADLPRLADLRATLRRRVETSPLMDTARFARNIESTYRQAWNRWCQRA